LTRVDVDAAATADLLQQVDYLSDYSAAAAERLIRDFEAVLEQLRRFPESGPVSRLNPELRNLRRHDHLFIYSYAAGDSVVVVRILHAKAEPGPR